MGDMLKNVTTWVNESYMVHNGFMVVVITFFTVDLIAAVIRFGKRHG